VLNRLFVAYPTPRDDKVRAPFIPETVLNKQNTKMDVDLSEFRDKTMRKLERDIEIEMGSKYFLDLKKHYLLKNEDEKYDIIPEIWEGHNIADFVDQDIVEKFKQLKQEEKQREEAGIYDSYLEIDDEEKELLVTAHKIQEKEAMLRLESRLKRKVDKRRMSRSIGRKRERSMSRVESEVGSLGVDVTQKRMRNFESEQEREQRGKKMHVGRSPSLRAHHSVPRDISGIRDVKVRTKVKKVARKSQKPMQRDARKGEGDRHVFNLMPKHLFSGKRGAGKTDRR